MRRAEREAIERAIKRTELEEAQASQMGTAMRLAGTAYGLKLALREADAARKRSARRARL